MSTAVMERILSIPGNKRAIARAREDHLSGQLIALSGAGASAEFYPVWQPLIEEIAGEAVDRGLANEEEKRYWLTSSIDPLHKIDLIHQRLGSNIFFAILKNIFGPRKNDKGEKFTKVQKTLICMNLKGYLTTNYDLGILEARAHLFPDCTSQLAGTWKDNDAVSKWINGQIFLNEKKPILFVHGRYDRSDSIVIDINHYRNAYKGTSYRQLFEKSWIQEKLLIVGAGFRDPWINFLAEDVLQQAHGSSGKEPNHIAIIGLEEGESFVREVRKYFLETFDAEAIFYPIASRDHSALVDLLDYIAS